MSQSNCSSVNRNRQLGIVREKGPEGVAPSLSSGNQNNSNGTYIFIFIAPHLQPLCSVCLKAKKFCI